MKSTNPKRPLAPTPGHCGVPRRSPRSDVFQPRPTGVAARTVIGVPTHPGRCSVGAASLRGSCRGAAFLAPLASPCVGRVSLGLLVGWRSPMPERCKYTLYIAVSLFADSDKNIPEIGANFAAFDVVMLVVSLRRVRYSADCRPRKNFSALSERMIRMCGRRKK